MLGQALQKQSHCGKSSPKAKGMVMLPSEPNEPRLTTDLPRWVSRRIGVPVSNYRDLQFHGTGCPGIQHVLGARA